MLCIMFGQTTHPAWFFDSSVHLEAVSRLMYLIESREILGIVTGPDGSGRSRVLTQLRSELARDGLHAVSLCLSGLDEEAAWWQLAESLRCGLSSGMSRPELYRAVRAEIEGRTHCELRTVLMLDDVHRANGNLNAFLRSLIALGTQSEGLVTLILTGNEPLTAEFCDQSLVRIELAALDSAEGADFVRSLFQRQSIAAERVDESAVRAVLQTAAGNTARMTRICSLLKVIHELSPETRLTEETVQAVLAELSPHTRSAASGQAMMRAS